MKTQNISHSKENLDAMAQRCLELEACIDQIRAAIADPESVFVNMKRGTIAKPSLRSMIDLYGEVTNVDEAQLMEIAQLRADVERLRQQAARYERLRRLNPRQFAELHQRNLAGERFDDMVDAL